jgi:hypothetical protein
MVNLSRDKLLTMQKRTKRTILLSVVVLSLMSFAFLQSQQEFIIYTASLSAEIAEQEVKVLTDGDIIQYILTKFVQIFNS